MKTAGRSISNDSNSLLIIPYELLLLVGDLLDIASVFSIKIVCKKIWTMFGTLDLDLDLDRYDIIDNIISNRYTGLFKWLHPNRNSMSPNLKQQYCDMAASSGSLEIVKYLCERGCEWNQWACNEAAKNGHLEILKYLVPKFDVTHEWNAWPSIYYAIRYGNLDILIWMYENDYLIDTDSCARAAEFGQLHILKWLRTKDFDWDINAYRYAARAGHLEILRYMRSVDGDRYIRNESISHYAAERSQLEVLKWLHENGYRWNAQTMKEAVWDDHLDVVKYLHENRCPCMIEYCSYCT